MAFWGCLLKVFAKFLFLGIWLSISSFASASTIVLVDPTSPTSGDELTFSLSHELDWDYDVPYNSRLTDEFSHAQFFSLTVFVNGEKAASLQRPIGTTSTYTTNPNGSYRGGTPASVWMWSYERVFDEAGDYEVSFSGQGYFWRALLPIPGCNCSGFTGGMAFDMSGSTTLTIAPAKPLNAVPLPAG